MRSTFSVLAMYLAKKKFGVVKFFLVVATSTMLFAQAKPVFATAGYNPAVSPSCSAGTSNCSNVIVQDTTYATNSTASLTVNDSAFFSYSLPLGTTIQSFAYKIRAYHTGSGGTGGGMFTPTFSGVSGCGFSYSGSTLPNSSSPAVYTVSSTTSPSCVVNGAFGFTGLGLSWGAGGVNAIDFIEVQITYTIPSFTASLDSSSASASAGVALLAMHGNFATNSASMTCEVSLFERCSASGQAGWTSTTPVAHIKFDGGSPQATTSAYGEGYYYGVSNLAVNDNWSFTGVEVPFNTGYTCNYPISYICYHSDCSTYYLNGSPHTTCSSVITDKTGQGLSSGSAYYSANLVASPSATINAPSDKQLDCGSDVWCQVINRVKTAIVSIFVPSSSFSEIAVLQTKEALTQHAPFAYVYPIFSFATTDPSSSSAVPAFTLTINSLGTPVSGSLDTGIPYIATLFLAFKNIIRFALYFGFVVYIVLLVRRLLPQ